MTDWIEHNGGPQPVGDDVWVEIVWPNPEERHPAFVDEIEEASEIPWEGHKFRFRILNQHLIDAARLEGIRLGLEAAAKEVEAGRWRWSTWEENERMGEWAIRLQNVYKHCELLIHNINPDTIAKEAKTT